MFPELMTSTADDSCSGNFPGRGAVRLGVSLVDGWPLSIRRRWQVNEVQNRWPSPPVHRIIDQWWLSPDRIFLMYPRV
jgi:hypothetical protein